MTVRKPQLFQSASVDELSKFVDDDAWALEQKVDGMRCLTVIKRDIYQHVGVEFFTRDGRELKSAAAKRHFDQLRSELAQTAETIITPNIRKFEIVLDAELMTDTGTLVVFDIPYASTNDEVDVSPANPYFFRRIAMHILLAHAFASCDHIVAISGATTTEAKRNFVEEVKDKNLEGFIAKRIDSPYIEGERVKHSLKIKLTQTADVVVIAKNAGESKHSKRGGDKINYEFGVYKTSDPDQSDEAELVHIGNCSGIGKENAEVGDVIEVEYLYAGAGGKLVQPRMIKLRDDKWPGDCTVEQLKYVNKEVL